MKFSYNWLQSFFEEELPKPKELAEILTMHSFEVEEAESIKYQVSSINYEDYLLDIDILPNRASDCLSYYGLAREVSAVTGLRTSEDHKAVRPPKAGGQQSQGPLTIEIKGEDLCPRYTAYVIENIDITDSPQWLKERLSSMEQKPINNIVDITNYIMWELGQPLHAFDFDKIDGAKMTIRGSKKGEELKTLDEANHKLDNDTIIIEDDSRIIDLAGIKGGANTQIDKDTKKIIFQAAIFESGHIRRASAKLGIRTDAAVRYMHGFDINLPPYALERAMEILRETNPNARIVQQIDIYPNPIELKSINLDVNYTNKLLGTSLAVDEIKQILERLGLKIEDDKLSDKSHQSSRGIWLRVQIPTYRLDLNIQEDLIEEIGRIYGYENIEPQAPRGNLRAPRRNSNILWRTTSRNILSGFGFSEVYNYSLIPQNDQVAQVGYDLAELQNPVSDEFQYLRPLLFSGIVKNFAHNNKYFDKISIFELGKVFYKDNESKKTGEREDISIALSDDSEAGFYRIKGYVDELLKNLGISEFYFDPSFSEEEEKYHGFLLHGGRRANIFLNNNFVGFIGEVHPEVLDSYGVKKRVFCAELDFEQIAQAASDEHIYQRPSKYPEVVRDVSLLVPREIMVVDVLNCINSVSGPLLRDIDLFDMYEGENLPEGKKNLAFHLLFQSEERTLTSEEADEIMAKIAETLEEKLWEIR